MKTLSLAVAILMLVWHFALISLNTMKQAFVAENLFKSLIVENLFKSLIVISSPDSVRELEKPALLETLLFSKIYPYVEMRVEKLSGTQETGMNTMLKMVIWLMAYFKEDMIFLLNEQNIFQRMSSQLSLNNNSAFFSPPRFSFPTLSSQPARMATSVG